MKTIINLLFLISISSITFGQKALKLNAHAQYMSSDFAIHKYNTDATVISLKESSLSFFPSPTVSFFTQRGNFHEIGLSRVQFNIDESQTTLIDQSITNDAVITSFTVAFRYDYNFKLTQKKSMFNVYIGVSTSLGYETEVDEPKITSSFKKSFYAFNSNIGIVPRIIWKLNNTVFLDLNTPINVFQIRYDHIRIKNPSLATDQQQYGEFSTKLLPINYEVRLGIGVFLFKES